MRKLNKGIVLIAMSMLLLFGCGNRTNDNIIFVCNADNDLYRAMVESNGEFQRFSSAEEAIEVAPEESGILVLSDNYPAEKVTLPKGFFEKAEAKNIKLYIELPDSLPGIKTGDVQKTEWERGVITSASPAALPPWARIIVGPVESPNISSAKALPAQLISSSSWIVMPTYRAAVTS